MKAKKDKSQMWIYTLFVIIILIGLFFFTGEYVRMGNENKLLKQAVIEYQRLTEGILMPSIAELRYKLKECKNANLN